MQQYLDALGLFGIAIIAVYFLGKRWLNKQAFKEIQTVPKIPMSSCDKHGLIPSDSMLHTTAVALGRPDLDVELCPICVQERTENVKRILAS